MKSDSARDAVADVEIPPRVDFATLQAAIDSMLDPYAVLQAVRGSDGTIVDFHYLIANDAACRFNQRSSEQLIGASLREIHPEVTSSGLFDAYLAVVETGEPLVLDDWSYRQELLGGEERRYDVRAVRIGDAVGQTWRDVTDRYRDAQALRDAEREYRLLAENAGDVVVRTRNGVALWISPSVNEQLGWDRDELLGTNLLELVHPDDRAMIEEARAAAVPSDPANRQRYRARNARGGWTWLETVTRLWVSEDGVVDGAVGTLRNIDAEMAALTELQRSQALHKAVVSAVGEGVMVVAAEGVIVQVNPACERILQTDAEGLVDRMIEEIPWTLEIEGEAEQVSSEPPFRSSLRSGESERGVLLRLNSDDGCSRWLVGNAEPVRDPAGGHLLVVSFTDVTQWREAEAQLAAEHNRLELVLTSIGLGTWDWRVPEDDIEFDEGWSLFTGSRTVALCHMTSAQWRDHVHPEDLLRVTRVVATCVAGDAPTYDIEYRVHHSTRSWAWIRERGHVLERDASGTAVHLMGTLEGIDELKAAQEALTASEAHYRMLAENASSIVTQADFEGVLLWVSPSIEPLLGWRPEEMLGVNVAHIVHPDDLDVLNAGQQQTRGGVEATLKVRARNPQGEYRWFKLLLRPTFDDSGEVTGRVAGWHDIDAEVRTQQELARSREQLQFLASHDPLTGVLNRREFTHRCESILAQATRPIGLLFVDVDDFKPVNDTYGHAVGDAIIRCVAERIVASCADALTARIGGDEFLILLPESRGAAEEWDGPIEADGAGAGEEATEARLLEFARRIEVEMAKPMSVDEVTVELSVSIGAARSYPGESVDSLIGHADLALYQAKRAGRARSALYRSGETGRAPDFAID